MADRRGCKTKGEVSAAEDKWRRRLIRNQLREAAATVATSGPTVMQIVLANYHQVEVKLPAERVTLNNIEFLEGNNDSCS